MITKQYFYNGENTNILVSENGDIVDIDTKLPVSSYKNTGGYVYVRFKTISGKKCRKGKHCIVAETFIPNPENKPQVNHKDGNKDHNYVSNLEWMTQSENNQHAIDNGLRKSVSGSKVHFAKYTEDKIKLACIEMSKNKLSLYDIEKLTGIPHKTLSEIRSGKIWKDISKNYTFPKNKVISSRIGLDYETTKKMKKLIKQGKSNKEIYEILGIEKSKKVSKSMSGIRDTLKRKKKLKNRMNKVQRLSNALEHENENKSDIYIDETIVFSWEMEVSRVAPEANAGSV